jgi:hypothetical protein
VTMVGHGVRLTISSLALCIASSAGAQGNLDQSKTADQLYASRFGVTNACQRFVTSRARSSYCISFGISSYLLIRRLGRAAAGDKFRGRETRCVAPAIVGWGL